jgi:hypothetical protein
MRDIRFVDSYFNPVDYMLFDLTILSVSDDRLHILSRSMLPFFPEDKSRLTPRPVYGPLKSNAASSSQAYAQLSSSGTEMWQIRKRVKTNPARSPGGCQRSSSAKRLL